MKIRYFLWFVHNISKQIVYISSIACIILHLDFIDLAFKPSQLK